MVKEQEQQQKKQKPEVKKQKLQYGNNTIEYSLIRSKRVKTSEITVEDGNVIIRTPFTKPSSEIERMVKEKGDWILRKKLEFKKVIPEIAKVTFEEDSTLPYLGKNYPLKIIKDQQRYDSEQEKNKKEDNIELTDESFCYIYLVQ
jgi:predicted metal-dependent hydrolase